MNPKKHQNDPKSDILYGHLSNSPMLELLLVSKQLIKPKLW